MAATVAYFFQWQSGWRHIFATQHWQLVGSSQIVQPIDSQSILFQIPCVRLHHLTQYAVVCWLFMWLWMALAMFFLCCTPV